MFSRLHHCKHHQYSPSPPTQTEDHFIFFGCRTLYPPPVRHSLGQFLFFLTESCNESRRSAHKLKHFYPRSGRCHASQAADGAHAWTRQSTRVLFVPVPVMRPRVHTTGVERKKRKEEKITRVYDLQVWLLLSNGIKNNSENTMLS